ncbi:MAG: hypothetical protein B6I38_01475 [Anaerolineaceae bacterium 4572_5.1]|nr:MAG: hypothetical protein B6I38_01475 [Anaerolineaceae bacterium 4572_5.1]
MKKIRMQYVWGALLITLGILFLLQEFNLIGSALDYLWILIMGISGIVFLWVYATKKDQWWAAIPGMTLIGLAATVVEEQFNFFPGSNWTGALFLAFIGLGFWLVYLRRPSFWWAIIPGGTLVTLGVVSGLGSSIISDEGIFFLGLGITFALVGLLPAKQYRTQWGYIPAAVLIILGLIQLSVGTFLINLWPIALIIIGGYIIFKNWKK